MIWTAILERDGQSSATSFYAEFDADSALKEISTVIRPDGYKILGLMKGDHCHTFYGVDRNTQKLFGFVNSE